MPTSANTWVESCRELPDPVTNQEPEVVGVLSEIDDQVTDLLGGPRPVRVGGDPQDVDVAAAHLYREQAIQSPQGHNAVHVEEVHREHAGSLRAHKCPPGGVDLSFGCRRYPQRLKDAADRGGADPMAELAKLALDPDRKPARAQMSARWCRSVVWVPAVSATS